MTQSQIPVSHPSPYTEEEISHLVHAFYTKARKDPSLGPIFEAHVTDWDAHFVQMINFWSGNLLGTNRFRGAPMPKHLAIPELSPQLFERWLQIFKQTTQELDNPALAQQATAMANRIAERLWMGYQMTHSPDKPMVALREV
ncbi:hemoglobin [Nitrosomonas cryotolerans]|uniref:Hemoglobin n=1 Tax=Nitrosomonas cryotolerans ATCC 49181 TaxID=1131553 RepID=A0A1N6IT39_9PROT|nr:group III truncated hemoglobin [Nitrosomonas cryotolerans]SFP32974.1 hemoglobin [Nitrosomonas cryotolerans]SIO35166.1 hemoglobin [Nitrosomonas cryotolerans ATCC 49181]